MKKRRRPRHVLPSRSFLTRSAFLRSSCSRSMESSRARVFRLAAGTCRQLAGRVVRALGGGFVQVLRLAEPVEDVIFGRRRRDLLFDTEDHATHAASGMVPRGHSRHGVDPAAVRADTCDSVRCHYPPPFQSGENTGYVRRSVLASWFAASVSPRHYNRQT
jgi:hypothetical protein